MEVLKPVIEMLIEMLASKHGAALSILVVIFAVIGVLRTIFKLVPGIIKVVTDATPSQEDDELHKKIEDSKWYKLVALILDYIASIKLPSKK